MKRIWKPLLLVVATGVLAAGLYARFNKPELAAANAGADFPVGISAGEAAPDFSGNSLEGETIRLSDYRGQIVVINDFATWCGPCLLETPHLVEIYNANEGEVAFIGLNLHESATDVADYRNQFDIPYPLLLDPDGKLTALYRPIGLPTSWFIDPEGVVRYVHAGPMTKAMVQEALDAVREGREPDVFSVAN